MQSDDDSKVKIQDAARLKFYRSLPRLFSPSNCIKFQRRCSMAHLRSYEIETKMTSMKEWRK